MLEGENLSLGYLLVLFRVSFSELLLLLSSFALSLDKCCLYSEEVDDGGGAGKISIPELADECARRSTREAVLDLDDDDKDLCLESSGSFFILDEEEDSLEEDPKLEESCFLFLLFLSNLSLSSSERLRFISLDLEELLSNPVVPGVTEADDRDYVNHVHVHCNILLEPPPNGIISIPAFLLLLPSLIDNDGSTESVSELTGVMDTDGLMSHDTTEEGSISTFFVSFFTLCSAECLEGGVFPRVRSNSGIRQGSTTLRICTALCLSCDDDKVFSRRRTWLDLDRDVLVRVSGLFGLSRDWHGRGLGR